MAENKVRKGFATYLFVLLLLIATAFLIVLVVMFFSPFKSILGVHYYSYDFDKTITNASGGSPIVLGGIEQINIDCNSANVEIIRDVTVDDGGIRITNHSSGFANASSDSNFDYNIYYTDDNKVLNIHVDEPYGFIRFSNNVRIYLIVSAKLDEYALFDTQINVTNTSGSVFLGNREPLEENETEIEITSLLDLNNISINSSSGKVQFRSRLENNLHNVSIKTDGSVTSQLDTINFSESFIINSSDGRFNFNEILYNGDAPTNNKLVLKLTDAQFHATKLGGNVELNLRGGYFDVDSVEGSLIANNTINQMRGAEIEILYLSGDVSLPFANSSNITIKEVAQDSQIYIHSTTGDISIDSLFGKAWIETTSGNVNITSQGHDIYVKTESGDIDVSYAGDVIDQELYLYSNSGSVDLNVKSNLAFILRVYGNNDEYRNDIEFVLQDRPIEIPITINNGDKDIIINTDGKVSIGILNIA